MEHCNYVTACGQRSTGSKVELPMRRELGNDDPRGLSSSRRCYRRGELAGLGTLPLDVSLLSLSDGHLAVSDTPWFVIGIVKR